MTRKINKFGEVAWIVGNIICAIGNCLVAKSSFGVAAVIAPPFVISRAFSFLTVGISEYIFQGILLAICCLVIRKFKSKFIATICNILFYGACFDIINSLLGFIQPTDIFSRIILAAVGTIVTSLGVAIMLRTYIPPSAYEIFVKEIAEEKGLNMNKFKLIFDASMFAIAIILMFVLIGEFCFDLIGPLTLISAFLNSILIAFFGKILDKHVDFSPAIPRLYNILNRQGK